jgi:hypothetical protein
MMSTARLFVVKTAVVFVLYAYTVESQAVADSTCNIRDLFQHLNTITSNEACRAGCNNGQEPCSDDWYPGSRDGCTADCGRIFEPFWDQCGAMLIDANMGGMEQMGVFYEHCVEELYPPGSCGTFCNEHTV